MIGKPLASERPQSHFAVCVSDVSLAARWLGRSDQSLSASMVYVASVVSLALLAVGIRHRRSRSTMALALPWRDATVTDGALHPADVDVPPSPVGALPPGPALVLLAPRANAVGPYRPGATKVIATRAGTLDDLRADALRNEFATLLWVTVAGVPVLCVTDGVPTVCVGAVVALALTWRLRVRRRVGSVAAGA